MTPLTKYQIITYRQCGMSTEELAKRFNYAPSTIRSMLSRAGVMKPKKVLPVKINKVEINQRKKLAAMQNEVFGRYGKSWV